MNLNEKVKNLTSSPGVYLMKDSLGSTIYVGKAKNLKKRVQTYFQTSRVHSPKVEKMIKNLKDFEYIITETEFEALMLECKLIRELKPMYNRKLKSPLSYSYIVIRRDSAYPSMDVAAEPIENDSNLYFGPYSSTGTVERTLLGIKECYKIPCSNPVKKNTPCLNHSLGLCMGMCIDDSCAEQYKNIVNSFIDLLNGVNTTLLDDMTNKMLKASEKLDFETASRYRDYINAVNSLLNSEKVIQFTGRNNNAVIIELIDSNIVKLFLLKRNKILFSKKYMLQGIQDTEKLNKAIKKHIIRYFRNEIPDTSTHVKKDEIDEAKIIYNYLKSSTGRYAIIPKQWLDNQNNKDLDKALNALVKGICIKISSKYS